MNDGMAAPISEPHCCLYKDNIESLQNVQSCNHVGFVDALLISVQILEQYRESDI